MNYFVYLCVVNKKAKNGQKVLVQVTKLPDKNSRSMEGIIIDIIGNPDARDIEMKSQVLCTVFGI